MFMGSSKWLGAPQPSRAWRYDALVRYNEKAAPFEWKKAVVFPSGPKAKYFDLCN